MICERCKADKPEVEFPYANQYHWMEDPTRQTVCRSCKNVLQTLAWRQGNNKKAAHYAVASALKRGRLKKPDACEECRKKFGKNQIVAHHDDYSKPLRVKWLCGSCHKLLHLRVRPVGRPGDPTIKTIMRDRGVSRQRAHQILNNQS